ncbi:hypothetical protein QBC33DRAFT_516720 [Phialemonium atrogriseum]|uniref:Uncharacterized protein n=1 Tax=Phialemonium atrogriseum TaxID=1093897 RepID=A0AAJ0BXV3_9PEZI|nr:uncharacterized protein QBC33DRAFT_516720 [Phialemonium atrogriseum]KAK1765393.1 hypothetical protein QBC33DRAFT_516720 [Phialemonium atrogriseum]
MVLGESAPVADTSDNFEEFEVHKWISRDRRAADPSGFPFTTWYAAMEAHILPGAFLKLQGRLKRALVQPLSNRCIVDRSGCQFQWVSEVVDPESGLVKFTGAMGTFQRLGLVAVLSEGWQYKVSLSEMYSRDSKDEVSRDSGEGQDEENRDGGESEDDWDTEDEEDSEEGIERLECLEHGKYWALCDKEAERTFWRWELAPGQVKKTLGGEPPTKGVI